MTKQPTKQTNDTETSHAKKSYNLYDNQGNVILSGYDDIKLIDDEFIKVEMKQASQFENEEGTSLFGLFDMQGNEIVPLSEGNSHIELIGNFIETRVAAQEFYINKQGKKIE